MMRLSFTRDVLQHAGFFSTFIKNESKQEQQGELSWDL